MSKVEESTIEKLARTTQEWITNNKTKAGIATAVLTTALGSGWVFWRLRALDHPSVPTLSDDTLAKHPFFGHTLHFVQWANDHSLNFQFEKFLNHSPDTDRFREAGVCCYSQCRIQEEHSNTVILIDPELIEFVWRHFYKGGSFINDYEEILGSGIFRSNGKQWENHRKIAARMFSLRNLNNFMFECGQRASIDTCDKISELMRAESSSETSVDIFELLGRLTMDSFVEICFGQKLGIIDMFPKSFPFSDAFDYATTVASVRGIRPWWQLSRTFNIGSVEPKFKKEMKVINEFVDEMLALDRRAELHDTMAEQKYDIVSLYKKHVPDMTDSELRDVAMNMIIAGRDTTRCLLGWTLAMLFVKHPEWLEKVREEINAIDSVELTHEQCKNEMKITECVLLETLRLYPSVPFSGTWPTTDLKLPNGFILRKDESVIIHHWSQARNTKIYGGDACEFKPMRWKEKGLNTFPPSVFGAFHVKPRVCLGRHFALTEAKTFLFYFLRRFDIFTDEFPKQLFGTLLNMQPWVVTVKKL